MELGVHGKAVLVTGGARGIGFAAAELLAADGARIALADLNGAQAQASAKRLSDTHGIGAVGIAADICDEADVGRMTARASDEFGGIDIWINTAAITDDKLFLESQAADWDRIHAICLRATMLCTHAILPGMVSRGAGRIVCVASDSAIIGQARLSYYAAAKAGVIAFAKSVAQEVGRNGVTFNIVSPGATNTEMRREREESLLSQMGPENYEKRVQKVLRMYPLRRLGEPEDAASAIAFLVSDRASWITGQVLSVNGGFMMA